MRKRTLLLAGGLLVVVVGLLVLLCLRDSRQQLSRTRNADGTWTVVIGQERLLGLFGIEIIYAREDALGHVSSGSVKGQCWSWQEAKQKYGRNTDKEGVP